MLNLPKSIVKQASTFAIASTVTVLPEGTALTSVLEDGNIVVLPTEGEVDEDFRGFAQSKFVTPESAVNTEKFSAPGASPYQTRLGKTPMAASATFYIDGTLATVVTTGTPTTGQVLVGAAGLLTFAAADAGKEVVALYRYQLTQTEAAFLFGFDNVPFTRQAEVQLSVIEVGLVFTDSYVITDDWANAAWAYTGVDGVVTTDDASGVKVGRVAGLPTANDGFLGLEISV